MPEISVIAPGYKVEKFLNVCIERINKRYNKSISYGEISMINSCNLEFCRDSLLLNYYFYRENSESIYTEKYLLFIDKKNCKSTIRRDIHFVDNKKKMVNIYVA